MIWIPSSSHFQFNQLVAETAEVYLQNRTNAKPSHPVWQPEKKSRSSRHKCMLVLTCVCCVGAIFRVDTRDRILSQSPTTTKQYYHRMTSHTVCLCVRVVNKLVYTQVSCLFDMWIPEPRVLWPILDDITGLRFLMVENPSRLMEFCEHSPFFFFFKQALSSSSQCLRAVIFLISWN